MPDELPIPSAQRWCDRDRPVLLALCAWMLLIFGLLWNPWWMPSGDAEVFIVTARNLFLGRGYVFNEAPISIVPPGWPLVLAGLFHLTDQYLWLKLAQIALMGIFLLIAYAILRRFVSVRRAGLACGLAAILWPLYPLTMWLHSDALFCALAGLVGLMCVHWGDGRLGRWWLALILLGCVLSVFVRWAALPQAIVLAALTCGSGRDMVGRRRRWPRLAPRHVIGGAAVVAITLGAFLVLKAALEANAGSVRPDSAIAPAGPNQVPAINLARVAVPEDLAAPELLVGREDPDISLAREFGRRIVNIPKWYGWTLFSPLRVADSLHVRGVPVGHAFDLAVGLLVMLLLALAAGRARAGVRGGGPHYLWLGLMIYLLALSLNWPHVNNRYVVPIAPFLIAGVLAGLDELRRPALARWLRWSFVAAVLAINGALWSVDVLISRSRTAGEFCSRWEAGIYLSLIEVGEHLNRQHEISDGEIVASERYQNLNERWDYPLSTRTLVLLTDHQVRSVPQNLTGWGVRKAQAWARETGARYYVQQNPTMPGRIWHFRVSAQTEEHMTGWPPARERPQFELFTMQPDPIPKNPDLQSLKYLPVSLLTPEELEAVTRRIPHLRR